MKNKLKIISDGTPNHTRLEIDGKPLLLPIHAITITMTPDKLVEAVLVVQNVELEIEADYKVQADELAALEWDVWRCTVCDDLLTADIIGHYSRVHPDQSVPQPAAYRTVKARA